MLLHRWFLALVQPACINPFFSSLNRQRLKVDSIACLGDQRHRVCYVFILLNNNLFFDRVVVGSVVVNAGRPLAYILRLVTFVVEVHVKLLRDLAV